MQWSKEPYAGFSTHTPWLSVIDNYPSINVEQALQDETSIFYHYQKLIALRKQYRLIQEGSYEPLDEHHPSVFAYKRRLGKEELLVVNNFYAKETVICVADCQDYTVLLSNYADSSLASLEKLRPYESIVFYRNR